MVRLVLFDIDGTLIRTHGAGVKAFERTLSAEFNAPEGLEQVKFAGRTDPSIIRELFGINRIEASPANFTRFYEAYVFWLDYLLSKSSGEICAGVWHWLHQIPALPQRPMVGLLTGNIRLGAEIKLRHFQLWDCFAMGAFGDDHEDRAELARIAQERAGTMLGQPLTGSQILVVGDTPRDVACAKAIQAKSLAVATGGATLEELKACQPDWTVATLSELDAATVCA